MLTGGAAEGVITSEVEEEFDELISQFVNVSYLQTPTSYHMHQLPARLRDVGVDENTLQINHGNSAMVDEITNNQGLRAQVCIKKKAAEELQIQ